MLNLAKREQVGLLNSNQAALGPWQPAPKGVHLAVHWAGDTAVARWRSPALRVRVLRQQIAEQCGGSSACIIQTNDSNLSVVEQQAEGICQTAGSNPISNK